MGSLFTVSVTSFTNFSTPAANPSHGECPRVRPTTSPAIEQTASTRANTMGQRPGNRESRHAASTLPGANAAAM
jgi:hypothetical protein